MIKGYVGSMRVSLDFESLIFKCDTFDFISVAKDIKKIIEKNGNCGTLILEKPSKFVCAFSWYFNVASFLNFDKFFVEFIYQQAKMRITSCANQPVILDVDNGQGIRKIFEISRIYINLDLIKDCLVTFDSSLKNLKLDNNYIPRYVRDKKQFIMNKIKDR